MRTTGDQPKQGRLRGILRDAAKTLAILLVASLLCEGLYRLGVGEQNIIIVMVLAVFIIAATTEGYAYGLAATLAGVFIYDFLVSWPRYGFSFTIGFPITFSIMLLVTLVTSSITARIKKQARTAREKEQHAERLYEINRRLMSARDENAIARHAMAYLQAELGRTVALYAAPVEEMDTGFYTLAANGDVEAGFFAAPAARQNALLAAREKSPVGTGTATRRDAGALYQPVQSMGAVRGVFGISCKAGPVPQASLPFVRMIADQAALALQVQALALQQQQALVMAETEKARNSFLRGISHDLRTPLTGIIGASATFLENYAELPAATRLQLVEGIQADSQWLMRMVENILLVTRLHQSDMAIKKTEEAAEEVVGEAVAQFRRRQPGADISIRQPEDLLLVPMDALLITQVLNNLLDNTHRHAGGAGTRVAIQLTEEDGFALFSVADNGPGVDEAVLPLLFGISPARPGHGEDAYRGLGIGLSICKAIVEVHGGWITAENLPAGGARFTFALPLDDNREAEDGDGV